MDIVDGNLLAQFPLLEEALSALDLRRVFVSGGLTPDNVAAAAALHPYAIDVASGVESTPGNKDHGKLASFIANARSSKSSTIESGSTPAHAKLPR